MLWPRKAALGSFLITYIIASLRDTTREPHKVYYTSTSQAVPGTATNMNKEMSNYLYLFPGYMGHMEDKEQVHNQQSGHSSDRDW